MRQTTLWARRDAYFNLDRNIYSGGFQPDLTGWTASVDVTDPWSGAALLSFQTGAVTPSGSGVFLSGPLFNQLTLFLAQPDLQALPSNDADCSIYRLELDLTNPIGRIIPILCGPLLLSND